MNDSRTSVYPTASGTSQRSSTKAATLSYQRMTSWPWLESGESTSSNSHWILEQAGTALLGHEDWRLGQKDGSALPGLLVLFLWSDAHLLLLPENCGDQVAGGWHWQLCHHFLHRPEHQDLGPRPHLWEGAAHRQAQLDNRLYKVQRLDFILLTLIFSISTSAGIAVVVTRSCIGVWDFMTGQVGRKSNMLHWTEVFKRCTTSLIFI